MMLMLFYLSGILTVFFCGIVMSHYTWHNVTESSRVTTKHTFATLSFVAETFIFLYVGMDALDISTWRVNDRPRTSLMVSSILLALVMAGRAAFIIIWWAGLMRGAVSLWLLHINRSGQTELRKNAVMITSTITVVLFSTVVFGIMTKPLIRVLLPHPKITTSMLSEASTPKSSTLPFLGSADNSFDDNLGAAHRPSSIRELLATPTHTVHRYWRRFDNAFMRPVFGGRGFVPFVPDSPTERSEHNLLYKESSESDVCNF
ncbi:sodium/hydrogen exchanger 2-like [Gossypium australe]|uniref:Sodium/hydrogen exchanger 2-like n=1 Tax=Gossypium australe TaxID=47621 RepID=A0A5B6VHV8_9ROSI|nr:sodium/hydrogen exchanger 2-like [Gossypium australe]